MPPVDSFERRTGFANGVRRERTDHDLIARVREAKRRLAEAAETVRVA
jgi:hypothetical protein